MPEIIYRVLFTFTVAMHLVCVFSEKGKRTNSEYALIYIMLMLLSLIWMPRS